MRTKKGMTRKEFLKISAIGVATTAAGCTTLKAPEKREVKEEQWAMVIDLDRCIGCQACSLACKSEFDTRLGVFKSQVISYEHGEYPDTKREFLPWLCNHCDNPPCVEICPVQPIDAEFKGKTFKKRATYKRPDGIVLVDQERCIGCGLCVENCPYRARFLDPGEKAGGYPHANPADKCTFCEHRVDAGIVPACVNTCQGRARIFGDLNDPGSEVSNLLKENESETLLPEKGTKPQVYYIGKTRKKIHESLEKGRDLRKEANSEYQMNIWRRGPYASKESVHGG